MERNSEDSRSSKGDTYPSVNSNLDTRKFAGVIPQSIQFSKDDFTPKQIYSAQFVHGKTGKLEIVKDSSDIISVKSDEISKMLGVDDTPPKKQKTLYKATYGKELWDCA
jgi:hypothetical protein